MEAQNMKDALWFQYENATVPVIALRTIDEFTIQGSTYGPVEKGREFDLPRWVAVLLASNNMVQLKAPEISVPDLHKALLREAGEPVLQPLTPNYYFQIRTAIEHLIQQNKKAPNDVRVASQAKMETLLRDLIANRLLKLMKLASREERIRETKKKMTEEERWLFDKLASLLRNWQKEVMEIGNSD
ncbi:DNA replication complex GINS family protein [Candidatus Bathyarchaeota archaeon]|nr:DNA replication complex GINS family protein [Candidatus Bathyarchaeota archaeon]